ncbi:MAG: BMP family ABC transporter substrate-binding protein [Candidatus Hadarchaeaceae archaeon]
MVKKLGERGITVATTVIIAVIVTAIVVGPVVYLAKPAEVVEREVQVPVKENVIMGFALGGYIAGSTWDGRYIVAAERLKALYDWFDYTYDEGVTLEAKDVSSVAGDLIEGGAGLVVGSWEPVAVPGLRGVADAYPDVYFLGNIGSDISTKRNFLRFFPRQYQAMYLEGLVAGALTETDKIGVAVGPAVVQNFRRMAAFYLGIKEVNPDATLYVKYVGEWYNPAVEREVSVSLVEDWGVDVLTNYTDSTSPVAVATEKGIWYVGKDTDIVSIGKTALKMDVIGAEPWATTDVVAVSFDTRWEVIWYHFLKEYLAGVEDPARLVFLGMDDYIALPANNPFVPGETKLLTADLQNDSKVGVDAISPAARELISDDVIELIEKRREQMMAGMWDPFFEYELVSSGRGIDIPELGLTVPAEGEVVKPARTVASDEFLLGMLNFELEGIVRVE